MHIQDFQVLRTLHIQDSYANKKHKTIQDIYNSNHYSTPDGAFLYKSPHSLQNPDDSIIFTKWPIYSTIMKIIDI